MPPVPPARWTDAEISDETRDDWAALLAELRDIPVSDDPVALPLTPEARDMYRVWYDRHAVRMADAETDALAATAAKIEGYAARLAMVRELADDPHAAAVDVEAMVAGIEMADWFRAEAERVYATMTERPKDRDRRWLVDWIIGRGGSCTARELRDVRKYRPAGAAQSALDELARASIGRWVEIPPGPAGGRPTRRFRLLDPDDPDDEMYGGTTGTGTKTPFDAGGTKTPGNRGKANGRGDSIRTEVVPKPPDEVSVSVPAPGVGADDDGRLDDDRQLPWDEP
jgi:hypothetical protein